MKETQGHDNTHDYAIDYAIQAFSLGKYTWLMCDNCFQIYKLKTCYKTFCWSTHRSLLCAIFLLSHNPSSRSGFTVGKNYRKNTFDNSCRVYTMYTCSTTCKRTSKPGSMTLEWFTNFFLKTLANSGLKLIRTLATSILYFFMNFSALLSSTTPQDDWILHYLENTIMDLDKNGQFSILVSYVVLFGIE